MLRRCPPLKPRSLVPCRNTVLRLAATSALLLQSGCSRLRALVNGGEPDAHAISLHQFADPGVMPGNVVRTVADASGTRRFCVRALPLISNVCVMAAKLEDTGAPERPAIRLLLDRQGGMLWSQICQETPGDSLAVLLDGFFWFALKVPRPFDPQSILLNGPIGRAEAEAIVKSVPGQYRKVHPSRGLF